MAKLAGLEAQQRIETQPLSQVAGGEAGFAGGVFEGVDPGLELGPFCGELAELFFGGGGIWQAK